MRKEEKTRRTYERILSAAIAEFGTKSYDSASLTTLCNENQISKGLVYHNFKNKDELYLKCVEKCFCEMTAYFRRMESKAGSMGENIQNLLNMRQKFFQENPYYCNIFFNTVLQPPEHCAGKSVYSDRGMINFIQTISGRFCRRYTLGRESQPTRPWSIL